MNRKARLLATAALATTWSLPGDWLNRHLQTDEGDAALNHLAATGKRVVLAEEPCTLFVDGDGIWKKQNDTDAPVAVSAFEAADVIVKVTGDRQGIVEWFQRQVATAA